MNYLILLIALCCFVGLITALCGTLAALPSLLLLFVVVPFGVIYCVKLLNKQS